MKGPGCPFCGAKCATCCDSRWITTEDGPRPCPACKETVAKKERDDR